MARRQLLCVGTVDGLRWVVDRGRRTLYGATMPTRFGRGYDSHLFGAERPLKLAGVEIPRPTGLARHFDGNAIACALTGRAARRGGASVTSVVCFPTPTPPVPA